MRRAYRRDAGLFNGTRLPGLLQEGKTRDQHKLQTLRRTMRGIVEDVLREGGVLTTDEIYRGVKAKHAQLGQLLPPRWQEEVKRILEAHCISHEGNSWFLEKLEPLEERPECEKRTDWANTESYRYLDLALGTWGFIVMTRISATVDGRQEPGADSAVAGGSIPPKRKGHPDFIGRGAVVVCKFLGDDSKRARRLREAMGFNGLGAQQKFAELLNVERGRWNNVECGAPLSKEMALRIVRQFPGVTLDWLFLGRTEGLTVEMALTLSEPSKGNDAGGNSPISPPPVTVQTVGLG